MIAKQSSILKRRNSKHAKPIMLQCSLRRRKLCLRLCREVILTDLSQKRRRTLPAKEFAPGKTEQRASKSAAAFQGSRRFACPLTKKGSSFHRNYRNGAALLRFNGVALRLFRNRVLIRLRFSIVAHPENLRTGFRAQPAGNAAVSVNRRFHNNHPFKKYRLGGTQSPAGSWPSR